MSIKDLKMEAKTVVSILGIRPDLIRCSEIIKKFDKEFNHTLVWSGQHFDYMLSDIFFNELEIRRSDYDLQMGKEFKTHHSLSGMIGSKVIDLMESEKIKPDAFFFLGDSNSVVAALALKKEYGDKIKNIHCEAGMRSYDKRMLEEINRTVCDHCSDIHFVYHEDYKENLTRENLPANNIYVVGNTIVEVCNKLKDEIMSQPKTKDFILMDVHRPENFKYKNRLENIIKFGNYCNSYFRVPVRILKFSRTDSAIKEFNIDLGSIETIDLMSYKDFLSVQYHSLFMISDSGTAQEEPILLKTPVIVPRDFTERPQSVWNDCSFMLNVNIDNEFESAIRWLNSNPKMETEWLGDGKTSDKIVEILKDKL